MITDAAVRPNVANHYARGDLVTAIRDGLAGLVAPLACSLSDSTCSNW